MHPIILASAIFQVILVSKLSAGELLSGQQTTDVDGVGQVAADIIKLINSYKCQDGCSSIDDKKIQLLESRMQTLEDTVQALTAAGVGFGSNGGATYVRWGRTSCPGNDTELVYNGVMAGGYYRHTGAGTNYLCATRNPEWLKTKPGVQNHGNFLYGTEYESGDQNMEFLFDHDNAASTHDHDAPCAVCRSNTRKSQVMIPGKITCEPGWTREYYGYLMTQHYNYNGIDYICVDHAPEADRAGTQNQNGALLQFVEARCGSLPCPGYVNGNEVTCVVCTK